MLLSHNDSADVYICLVAIELRVCGWKQEDHRGVLLAVRWGYKA